MEIIKKNVQRNYKRNKDIVASGKVSIKGGITELPPLNYLPATLNSDGSYTVDLDTVNFNGSIIALKEVSAYGKGNSEGGGGSNIKVIDLLTSTSTTNALSANQGRVLKDLIDSKTVDVDLSDYYNKTTIDQKVSSLNTAIAGKANTKHTHTKADITDLDLSIYYDKETSDKKYQPKGDYFKYYNQTAIKGDTTLWNKLGVKGYSNALPDGLTGAYTYGEALSFNTPTNRFDIYCSHTSSSGNGLYYRSGYGDDKKPWAKIWDSKNLDITPYNTHIADKTIHITKTERDKWNAKLDKNTLYEGDLKWGGKNHTGGYGPIDAAMIPDLGANRLAFMPSSAITVEYSRDGGITWQPYNVSDASKINLFNGLGTSYSIGATTQTGIDKSKHQVRITFDSKLGKVYTTLNKFSIYVSTEGSYGSWCTIEAKTKDNVTNNTDTWKLFAEKVRVEGWGGFNIINLKTGLTTYGNKGYQYQKVRFTFGVDKHPSDRLYRGLMVMKIMGYGGVGWSTPSNLAKYGTIYSYDSAQNVKFPAGITATTINGAKITSTTFNGYIPLDKAVWDKAFYFDSNNNIRAKLNLIGDKEVAAYGVGSSSSGGGAITIIDSLNSSATNAALSANQGRILKSMIDNIPNGGGTSVDLSNYYDKTTSDGRYAYKNDIKTKTSQLTNDSGYITSYTNNYLSSVSGSGNGTVTFNRQGLTSLTLNLAHTHNQYLTSSSLNGYAKTSQIPTKVSQLTNDKGYLTSHQPLDDYVRKDGSNWSYSDVWADKMIGKSIRWVDTFGDMELLFADYSTIFGEDTLASATDILCIDRDDTFGAGGPTAYPVTLSEFCTNGADQTLGGDKIFTGKVQIGESSTNKNTHKLDIMGTANIKGDILNNQYALHNSSDGKNPYLKFIDYNNANWYCQAYQDKIMLGSTAAKSLQVDQNGNTTINGNLTVLGNIIATGEVTAYKSDGTVVPFLVNNATTNSTTQAPTAAALKKVNDEKNVLATKINTIKTQLNSINSNSDLNAIRNVLINIKNNL